MSMEGSVAKTIRKRKTSENETASRQRNSNYCHIKEDLENKQGRKKNAIHRGSTTGKKKVLEEANNSKLRDVQVRVEDCLQNVSRQETLSVICRRSFAESVSESISQASTSPPHIEDTAVNVVDSTLDDDTSNGSSVQLVPVEEEIVCSADDENVCKPVPETVVAEVVVSEEDDCVIVAQRTTPKIDERECSSRGDDDGPLSSSSPFNRMELTDSVVNTSLLRFPDDRSDSGVSSLRSGSGDERSGSRSSALSSSDEPPQHSNSSTSGNNTQPTQPTNRSPLFLPANSAYSTPSGSTSEPVRVWRDPNLLLESEPHVRHIHSVQHQSLLMSHPSTPAASGPPPNSAATHPTLYPPVAPPPMGPHLHHPHLGPPSIYPHHLPEMIWNKRYIGSHIITQQVPHSGPTEDLLERNLAQDRMRHNHDIRDMEKQREKEREQRERDRLERDRQEREKLDREKHEKEQRQAQAAVQKHFEESLKRIQQKPTWNLSLPPPSRGSNSSEEERKRVEQEHHQREQQRLMVSRQEVRDRTPYFTVQRPPSAPNKTDYPPPAHSSRVSTSKANEKLTIHQSMQKTEVNAYGYPAYQPNLHPMFPHEPKSKSDHHKSSSQSSGLVMIKSGSSMERERDVLTNPPPLLSEREYKSSVIVKHEKNPHHMDSRVPIAHSKSPQLRTDIMGHYITSGQLHKSNLYDYRSPTQSPHHPPHTPSPHHLHEPQNLGKTHHRSSGQLPSPHHQQQSPHHPHAQQHPSPELRYRSNSESSGSMIYSSSGKVPITSNYTYISPSSTISHYTVAPNTLSNTKPKVSSPAPHHIYGKPSSGIGGRTNEVPTSSISPLPLTLTSKPLSSSVSSPYQQVSQYHPPIPQNTPTVTGLPPPAHSSRTTIDSRSAIYDRMYTTGGPVPGGLSVKPSTQHGTSPPTAASAPSPISRPHSQYTMPSVTHQSHLSGISSIQNIQTQPLDFCVTSKYDSATSPKRKATPVSSANTGPICLENKKRRIDPPSSNSQNLTAFCSISQPQLARVSEPSPLIVNAATTITTVVNTAALRSTPNNLIPQNQPVLVESLPDVSVTAVTIPTEKSPTPAEVTTTNIVTPSTTPVTTVSITVTQPPPVSEAPNTPIKLPMTPTNPDSEKSNSPGPIKSSNYPVRHLKKAWLERHTGEGAEDNTGVMGTGSCVTLPINIATSTPSKEPSVNTLHSIGSMAVNSINKSKPFGNKSNNRKSSHKESSLNGHPDATKGDDSSSSDPERNRKDPPKRKPPKVKRKKGGGAQKKSEEHKKRKIVSQAATVSESGSDSEKESGSEKDSDSCSSTTITAASGKKSNSSTTSAGKDKEPRKRGRRPKTSKNDKGEEPRPKKSKDDILPQRDPFRKPPVGQLKKTGESFLQDGPCFEVAPKLAKCRECRWTPNQRSRNMPNIFCRFYAFRRLRYTKNGQLAIAGFSDPHKDASEEDLKLWLPSSEKPPVDLDLETSRFLLKQVGDHFCNLLAQENDAHAEHMSEDKTIAWKRVVQGVREMCDVCETTLFNFHWACGKCGFVVCLDCYKGRKNKSIKIWGEPGKDRDDYSWLLCTNRQPHEQEKLMLTQIIAGDSLLKLGRLVHEMRELWNVEQYCDCALSKEVSQKSNGARKEIIRSILAGELNGIKKEIKEDPDSKPLVNGGSVKDEKNSLSWLADVALSNEDKKNDDTSDSDDGSFSTLRELLIRPSHKHNGSRAGSPVSSASKGTKKSGVRMDTLDEVISSVIEDSVPKHKDDSIDTKIELKHFIRRDNYQAKIRGMLPIRIMTLTESKLLYPDIPHSWLCDGKLLRLSDTTHQGNYKIYQDQWKRGQPVLVSDVTKHLSKDLWMPESFIRDFGDEKNDLVNCLSGNIVVNQPMRKFWEGFEHLSRRLKDEKGNPMLLKLKDWPPGEDFAEMLPSRFADLMKVLPLSEYTHRNGRLNLASRLPDCFVRPDLGPKMYNAYGSALYPSKGTTNLHLDISDAVNVMVYVGIPKDGDCEEHIKEAFRAIDEAGCDILTRRRVRDKGELPGALWHIYNARDADKIRDLLNKVVVEKGGCLEPNHDPIHDQSCYLDGPLRERLYKEYGVEGYAIVQCLGDAVFIPAGAPHQVRNLHNCIKVAEDFVSPENVSHCFHLTQEFRDLSDTHTNHEDKLQIKNIIYHAVKDSLSTLTSILNKHAVKLEKDGGERNGNGECADELSNTTMDSSEPA